MLSCALVALYLLLYIKLLVIDVTKAETFNTNVIFFTFALSFIKAYMVSEPWTVILFPLLLQ